MSEKRFINDGEDIFQYGEWWCSAKGGHCADVIATAMNELLEENEKLKQENNKIKKILLDKRKDLECAYDCAVKAGMPTGGTIGELDTIEDILEELGLKK